MSALPDIAYYLGWALLLGVVACGCWRIARGPTTLDRMVGFDTLVIAVVGLACLFSIHARTAEYVELILVVTALGFFTTVCFYYYLAQPKRRGGEDFNEEDNA